MNNKLNRREFLKLGGIGSVFGALLFIPFYKFTENNIVTGLFPVRGVDTSQSCNIFEILDSQGKIFSCLDSNYNWIFYSYE